MGKTLKQTFSFILTLIFAADCFGQTDINLSYKIIDNKYSEFREYVGLYCIIPQILSKDSSDFSFINKEITDFISNQTDIYELLKSEINTDDELGERYIAPSRDLGYTLIITTNKLLWLTLEYEEYGGGSGFGHSKLSVLADIENKKILNFNDLIDSTQINSFKNYVIQEVELGAKKCVAELTRPERGYPEYEANRQCNQFNIGSMFDNPIGINKDNFQIFYYYSTNMSNYWADIKLPLVKCLPYFTDWVKKEITIGQKNSSGQSRTIR